MISRDLRLSSDQELLVGIDVGSTTTKIVAVDPEQGQSCIQITDGTMQSS